MVEIIINVLISLCNVHTVLSFDLHTKLKAGLLLFSHLINEETEPSTSKVMQVVIRA